MIAYTALFFALTGAGVAAKPLVTSADIQDNTVASVDIKDGDIQAIDVMADSLTGTEIDESTLTLPSAAGSVAHHWIWALTQPTDPTEGAPLTAGDWTLTPTCDSTSLRLDVSGPSGYSRTLELTTGTFVSETAFNKILPDLNETLNGTTLPSALDIHAIYGRTAVTGLIACGLAVVATAAAES